MFRNGGFRTIIMISIHAALINRAVVRSETYPQHGDRILTDGTCCTEPGRCGGLGIYIPECARNTSYIFPPTKVEPVPAPPPLPPLPDPPLPVLTCWDGSRCPGRVKTEGVQCCSAGVKAGVTCSQIFICD